MRRSTKQLALSLVTILSVFPFFSNCSAPMEGFVALASLAPDTALSVTGKSSAVNERALLTAEQVLKSMSSVTGVPIDNDITGEYGRQQDVLSGSFSLETVTAPMLIGITNLSGKFCAKLVARESGQSNLAMRKFFKTIAFNTRPENLQAADYSAALEALALSFWGRSPSSTEMNDLMTARTEFLSGRDSTKASTSTTSALMVMVCTGMLASFESYTL